MFISAERLWDMDRMAEITSAKRQGKEEGIKIGEEKGIRIGEERGKEKGIKIGEKKGAVKTAKETLHTFFSVRFPENQNSPELERRLNALRSAATLKAKTTAVFQLRPEASFDEALSLL